MSLRATVAGSLRAATLLASLCCGLANDSEAGFLDSAKTAISTSLVTPVQDQRGTEQTFLTFPEWFLVHSPAEYAVWVQTHTPTTFPFLGHIRQFWQSYAAVSRAANERYPFNLGYHVMIMVIGSSTTLEYALRSAYETLIGRVSEATQSGGLTPEDHYAARVAQEYVDFIRVKPWYAFDFSAKLAGLWTDTPLFGSDLPRKWERRYALTTEYAIKAVYAWLIGLATQAGYDEAAETTVVVLDRMPQDTALDTLAKFKVLKPLPDGAILASLPRYQAFMDAAAALAAQGVGITEIAGNRGPILVSMLTNRPPVATWSAASAPGARVLFEQPILTDPGRKRVALVVPVAGLAGLLRSLTRAGATLEHIYDY